MDGDRYADADGAIFGSVTDRREACVEEIEAFEVASFFRVWCAALEVAVAFVVVDGLEFAQ